MIEFKRTIMALASEPEIQDKLFPDFACKGDELVLEFDKAYRSIKEDVELSEAQKAELSQLDKFLEEHSGKNFENLYIDNSAIFSEPFWADVRIIAKKIITVMNWAYEEPKPSGATYVGKST